MQIGIVYQDGRVYMVYDSGDFAADEAKRLQKAYPAYDWTYAYHAVIKAPVGEAPQG